MHKKKFIMVMALVFLVYSVFSFFLIIEGADKLRHKYFAALGSKAQCLAMLAVKELKITNSNIEYLKSHDFKEIIHNELNNELLKLFDDRDISDGIRYVYIINRLRDDEIKYYVDENDKDFYKQEVGTPLNAIWLLDVVVNKDARLEAKADFNNYYKDKNRYTFMRPNQNRIYLQRNPRYTMTSDEWGNVITGYAPIYTVEGNYIGLLGVDMYYENLSEYTNIALRSAVNIFLITALFLAPTFAFLYREQYNKLKKEVYIDALTQLYNRNYYDEVFPKIYNDAFEDMSSLGAIMIDIDNFKAYNDTYGHLKGDDCLRAVGKAIKMCLRKPSDVAIRYGGEEFILFLPYADENETIRVAKKINKTIYNLKIEHSGSTVEDCVTVSLGVCSEVPKSPDAVARHRFIKRADDALYRAKRNGKNCCCCSNNQNVQYGKMI